MIEVVIIIFIDNKNKIYIGKRHSEKILPNFWEFIGGKIKSNETKEEAIFRECKKEIDLEIDIKKVEFLTNYQYQYPAFGTDLYFYTYKLEENDINKINNKIHEKTQWVSFEELKKYRLLEANKEILNKIENYLN